MNNYANEWVDDVIASCFPNIFVYKIGKFSYIVFFGCSNMWKHIPISKYSRAIIIMHLFRVDVSQVYFLKAEIWDFREQN